MAPGYRGELVEEYRDADGSIFDRYVEERAYYEIEVEPDGILRIEGFVFGDGAVYLDPDDEAVPGQYVSPLGAGYTYEVTGGTWSVNGERLELSVEGVLTFEDEDEYHELVALRFQGAPAYNGRYPIEDGPLAGVIEGKSFEVVTASAWPKESGGFEIRLDAVERAPCSQGEPEWAERWVLIDIPARVETPIEFSPLDERVMLAAGSEGGGWHGSFAAGQVVVDEHTEERIRGGLTAEADGRISGRFDAEVCVVRATEQR